MKKRITHLVLIIVLVACDQTKKESSENAEATKPIVVTAENFARAESDMYFAGHLKRPGAALGKMTHDREVASVDRQPVIRYNRDVLLSSGLFDLKAGPVTITIPDPGKRFISILVINEDHYNPIAEFGSGKYIL